MPALSAIQTELKEHEPWLTNLRQTSNMTIPKIQTELKDQRGVHASRSQLETYFRNSGQRKNLSRPEWVAVFCALDSQKEFGCIFDVLISGKLITEPRLQKKRRIARPVRSLAPNTAAANRLLTQLPDRVTFRPRLPSESSGSDLQHNFIPQPVFPTRIVAEVIEEAHMVLDTSSAANNAVPGLSISTHDASAGINVGSSDPQSTRNSDASQNQVARPPSSMEADPDHVLAIPEDLSLLMMDPGFEPPYDLMNFGMDYDISTHLPDPNALVNWNGRYSPVNLSPELENQGDSGSLTRRHKRHSSHWRFPTPGELLDNLQSLVSIETAGVDFLGPVEVIGGPGIFRDRFLGMLFFSIVNNFAGIDAITARLIMKFINQHDPVRSGILSQLKNGISTVFSRALVEKLFEAAIEACDARAVHNLLALGIGNLDDIVCTDVRFRFHRPAMGSFGVGRRTPIEKASFLRFFDIMELLLNFGADANKTYQDIESDAEQGALECAIHLWGEYRPVDPKVLDLLLHHGATISGRLMESAIRWRDTALIEKFMSHLPPSEHVHFFSKVSMLPLAAEHLRTELGYKVIRQVIQACRDMHDNACIKSKRKLVADTLVKAAGRKNIELVHVLLLHGDQEGTNSALIAASRSGSHSLVHFLLAHGARADGPACSIDGPNKPCTTALAEAIRAEDVELVDIFAKEGAWDQIAESGRLEAALHAIAESGNLAYLLQVLRLVPNPAPRALGGPLSAAIKAQNDEVALKLVEAGAEVDCRSFWPGTGSPLLEALRNKSEAITWAILESEVQVNDGRSVHTDRIYDVTILEAATAWGDPQIIKALVFMGAEINACRYEYPLAIAIRAGDRSLVELLISLGADLNASSRSGSSPLAAAALVGDAEIANYLLDHGADPADEEAILNAISHDRRLLNIILQKFREQYPKGNTGFGGKILCHALQTHDEALLDLCLDVRFDVNDMRYDQGPRGMTALGRAIKEHRETSLENISKLLNAGGDVNLPASQMGSNLYASPSRCAPIHGLQTAFLDAIETKSLPLVKLLISWGADVQKEAKLGLKRTPLQKACEVASHNIVELLLQHNVDVNAAPAPRGGATALQLASKLGSTRIAKKLLDLGANVNAPGVRVGGRSAIEYAAEYGRLSMIPVLYNAANGKFAAGQYGSAIALAQENGHLACAMLLRNLSSQNQAFIDAVGMEDDGARASVAD